MKSSGQRVSVCCVTLQQQTHWCKTVLCFIYFFPNRSFTVHSLSAPSADTFNFVSAKSCEQRHSAWYSRPEESCSSLNKMRAAELNLWIQFQFLFSLRLWDNFDLTAVPLGCQVVFPFSLLWPCSGEVKVQPYNIFYMGEWGATGVLNFPKFELLFLFQTKNNQTACLSRPVPVYNYWCVLSVLTVPLSVGKETGGDRDEDPRRAAALSTKMKSLIMFLHTVERLD